MKRAHRSHFICLMALIYFFRHGQAGTRNDYDRLSDLGREQARRLGEWISGEGLTFDRILCGGLKRQKETAEIALGSLVNAEVDTRWSEFDLDAVYSGIAPLMAAEDAGFKTHWEELERTIASGDADIHRRWTRLDSAVVEAWIRGRYKIQAESWKDFVARVLAAGEAFQHTAEDAKIAIFTSATPTSIWVSEVLGSLGPERVMRFAGASLNTAMSVLHRRNGDLNLFTFNAVPHLGEPRLRTFR